MNQRSTKQRRAKTPPAIVHDVLRAPGEPLRGAVRSAMESRFGRDFSGVRVHVGDRAAESARAVSARAYTAGRDIVFGAGEYAPESSAGRALLAHELTHVVQQGASRGMPTGIEPPGGAAEREARRIAGGAAGPSGVEVAAPAASLQRIEIPDLRLETPTLDPPTPARPSLFPAGERPRLSLGFEEDLLEMRGVAALRPRPSLPPQGVPEGPQPLPEFPIPAGGTGSTAAAGAAPEKDGGDMLAMEYEFEPEKDSDLDRREQQQEKEKGLVGELPGEKAEDSPLGKELLKNGIKFLDKLPPFRGARERFNQALGIENLTVIADKGLFVLRVTLRFGHPGRKKGRRKRGK